MKHFQLSTFELPPMREFFSAPPLLAVAVLAVNDAFLKATFHNAITGKLSDFAGCFFLPLFVSALLSLFGRWSLAARLSWGVGATLSIFIPTTLFPWAAAWLCSCLEVVGGPFGLHHYRIASDSTDLIALPMTALAVMHGLRRAPSPSRITP